MQILRIFAAIILIGGNVSRSIGQIGDTINQSPDALLILADSAQKANAFSYAVLMVEAARNKYLVEKDWDGVAKTYEKEARIFDYQDLQAERLPPIQSGLIIAQQYLAEDAPIIGRLYQQRAEAMIGLNRFDQVEENLLCAQAIHEQNGKWEDYAWTLILESVSAYYVQDFDEMGTPLSDVLEMVTPDFEEAYQLKSTALQLQTILFSELGDVREAIKVGEKSLSLLREEDKLESQDSVFMATLYQNIGVLNRELGDMKESQNALLEARRILEYLSVPTPIQKHQNRNALAYTYFHFGDYALAEQLYLENLTDLIPTHPEEINVRISTLQNLTKLYLSIDKIDDASEAINRAYSLSKISSYALAETNFHRGIIHQKNQQYFAAKNAFDSGKNEVVKTLSERHPNIALAHTYLGDLQMAQNHPDCAALEAQQALSILIDEFDQTRSGDISYNPPFPNTISRKTLLRAFELKMRALQAMHTNNPDPALLENAFAVSELSVVLLDSMRQDLQEDNARQELMQRTLQVYEQAIDLAWQLYQVHRNETYLAKAFEISEKSKAVLLLNRFRLDEAITFGNIPDSLLERERDLRRQFLLYESRLVGGVNDENHEPHRIEYWQKQVFDLKEEHRRLLDTLAVHYPDYHRIKYETAVATAEEVQAGLDEDGTSAWVQYFAGEEHVYVFGITKHHIQMNRIAWNPEPLREFVQALSEPEYAYDPIRFASWTRTGYELYEQLLKPVLVPKLRRLTIVPDGELAFLPFEVLLMRDVSGESVDYQNVPYVLRDYVVNYDYSATVHAKMGRRIKRTAKRNLAGFAPTFANEVASIAGSGAGTPPVMADLRYNRLEIERIAALAGGQVYLGESATEQEFIAQKSAFQVLHLATHAFTRDDNPWLSGLAFAPGAEGDSDFLSAGELCRMEIDADLAVLSACNTGRGTLRPGEGVMSLAWAFKYAGCPSVIMSQWQVDDAATQEVMSGLYSYLNEGRSTAEALRQAKLDFLESAPHVHPYYWSAFMYMGEDREMGWGKPWYRRPLYVGGVLLLILALALAGLRWRTKVSN